MTDQNKESLSPMLQDLQKIIDSLPSMAKKLPGLPDVIQFVGRVVRRQDKIEARLNELAKKIDG